jgi:hypothetical protein
MDSVLEKLAQDEPSAALLACKLADHFPKATNVTQICFAVLSHILPALLAFRPPPSQVQKRTRASVGLLDGLTQGRSFVCVKARMML